MSSDEQWLLTETLNGWDQLSESDRLAKGDETRELVRRQLADLPSQQLLSLIYGSQSSLGSHPLISELRANNPRRRDLLQTIYENRWRATESTYVRLPSAEKRLLVNLLVGRMKKRHRWFSSRLLHAYAFRPQGFKPWDTRATSHSEERGRCAIRYIHPLYSRVEITRRPGNPRILYVPTPPLKRLQREILEICLNPAMTMMPESIMGCRKKSTSKSFGIFANASAHLGQQFVAKFDLKDFFPSVQIADIVETLQRLKTPMVSHLDEKRGTLIEIPWTHDAAVLVARLVTRFGHLPQGAPTSPAIANLVFTRLDREIETCLGPSVVYTRYVDDLTFSISRQVATKLGITTSANFLAMLQPIVCKVLEPTTFSLNDRKTRVSDLRGGHSVTGLSVGKSQVNLPRDTRRRLRGLIHRIERDGVVPVAQARIGAERFAELCKWTSAIFGDTDPARKTSRSEASIASFIRSLCPKLVTEIPQQTFAVGTKRVVRDYQLHEGRAAIKDCLFLLPYLWAGEISAQIEGGHLEIRRTVDGLHVASLRAERNIELIALSSRDFHATLNLWSHLRGWSAGLHTPSGDSCFADVSHFREMIERCLEAFRIQLPKPSGSDDGDVVFHSESGSKAGSFSLHPNITRLSEAAHRVYLVLEEMTRDIPGFPLALLNDLGRDLEFPAEDKDALRDWFNKANQYWRILPRFELASLNRQTDQVQRLIEVMHERLDGQRTPIYQVENDLLSPACHKHSVESLNTDDCNHVQLQTLKEMSKALEAMRQEQRASTSPVFGVPADVRSRDVATRLLDAFDKLILSHEYATWKETNEPAFKKIAATKLRRARAELAAPVIASTTDQVWEVIAKFAVDLIRWTTDSLTFKKEIFSENVRQNVERMGAKLNREAAHLQVYQEVGDKKEVIEVLFLLRNHGSHGEDPKRKQDWPRIERYVAALLGKRHGKNSKHKNRLQLSECEASEVKLIILQQLCAAIEKMKPTR